MHVIERETLKLDIRDKINYRNFTEAFNSDQISELKETVDELRES